MARSGRKLQRGFKAGQSSPFVRAPVAGQAPWPAQPPRRVATKMTLEEFRESRAELLPNVPDARDDGR